MKANERAGKREREKEILFGIDVEDGEKFFRGKCFWVEYIDIVCFYLALPKLFN